jgi:hypothetical protein
MVTTQYLQSCSGWGYKRSQQVFKEPYHYRFGAAWIWPNNLCLPLDSMFNSHLPFSLIRR